jgi:hypothetical protein
MRGSTTSKHAIKPIPIIATEIDRTRFVAGNTIRRKSNTNRPLKISSSRINIVTPTEDAGSGTYGIRAIHSVKYAPKNAPVNCPATRLIRADVLSLPSVHTPIDTAGFRCTSANEYPI